MGKQGKMTRRGFLRISAFAATGAHPEAVEA